MGEKIGLVVIGALLLTGCGSTSDDDGALLDRDAKYIDAVRPVLHEYAGVSDQGLIEFAPEFCEQAEDGISLDEMRLGARKFNTPARADELGDMGEVALSFYCPGVGPDA